MLGRPLILAGVLGCLGVAFGAFGAHGLRGVLSMEALGWVETGSRYQLIHAAVLVALAMMPGSSDRTSRLVNAAALVLFFGAFVFGAALYLLAITGQSWLGAVAPVGGVLMILGWGLLLAAGIGALSARRL